MSPPASPPRIPPETTETFTVIGGRADAGIVVLCDHAANAFPPGYGTLGLERAELKRHIAYDIGAAEITRQLAAAFDAPAVLTHYSRLLIDPNRGTDDPTLIMRLSDGAIVPGNRHVDADERAHRIARYWQPYHRAIAGVIDRCVASGRPPAVVSVHSFTESWKGVPRPWHVGVLWDDDTRLVVPLLAALHAGSDLIVGENEPYKGGLEGDTIWQHARSRGLPSALIEVRQDLIRELAGQTSWARRLADALTTALARLDQIERTPIMTTETPKTLDESAQRDLEAAAYRRLVTHLRTRTDVQNIDLMNLAGFCRNCLANWLADAATERKIALSKDEARTLVYGMPYAEWRALHQREATPEQAAAFAQGKPHQH